MLEIGGSERRLVLRFLGISLGRIRRIEAGRGGGEFFIEAEAWMGFVTVTRLQVGLDTVPAGDLPLPYGFAGGN